MCDRETAQNYNAAEQKHRQQDVIVHGCERERDREGKREVERVGGGSKKYIRVRKLLTCCHPILLPSGTLAYLF